MAADVIRALLPLLLYADVISVTFACDFPAYLQTREADIWYTNIKLGDLRGGTRVTVEKEHLVYSSGERLRPWRRWTCTVTYLGKFLVKRTEVFGSTNVTYYSCMGFHPRSPAILQVEWSEESLYLDPVLCDEDQSWLDPWLLVRHSLLMKHVSPCPFSGGFDLKLRSSSGKESGCNYMHLPMRLEIDCLAGEGATFDFRSRICVPETGMHEQERTLCAASWTSEQDHFLVLRRDSGQKLWCLRFPRSSSANVTTAFLFSDLACVQGQPGKEKSWYHELQLERTPYPQVCMDEYSECERSSCTAVLRTECQRTCSVCRYPPPVCSFAHQFQGAWLHTDTDGVKQLDISDSVVSIERVGEFQCVVLDGSPSRQQHVYTAVTLQKNGCRPRYSCLKLRRLGPSVASYSLASATVWPRPPEQLGAQLCHPQQFQGDPEPLRDLYRSYSGTGKPIVALTSEPGRVHCNLSSSYTLTARFPDGQECMGSLFEDCKDVTRLRLDMEGCKALPGPRDYNCLAVYEGKYWEKVVLLQSMADEADVRCLVFSDVRPSEALVMVAGQCDKLSWGAVDTGLRAPLMRLQIRPDIYPCKELPVVDRLTPPSPGALDKGEVGIVAGGGGSQLSDDAGYELATPHQRGRSTPRPPGPVLEPSDSAGSASSPCPLLPLLVALLAWVWMDHVK